jgi:glyoxylase-like metal-dependent hydrolase (beta-lactamase superfamily II)
MLTNRRNFLATSSAAVLAANLSIPARATAPFAGAVIPVYRHRVGDIEITAIADGYLDLDRQAFFPQVDRGDSDRLLEANFQPTGKAIRVSVNAFLVNTGERLILIDSGTIPGFAPSLAKLPARLQAAGVSPDQIDTVLMTHLHPDHIGALLGPDGKPRFAKAEFILADAEWKFWSDEGIASRAPKDFQPMFAAAQSAGRSYEKVARYLTKNGEVVKGIESVGLPGHTPGHTGYLISSGKDSLLIWGDVVHATALQFTHPEWSIAFDTDQSQAASTRRAIFDRAAADRLPVAGMHLDFPSFGHVIREGADYRFTPAIWRLDE